jgi:hypothetical protein
LHRNEAICRLIDRAQEKPVPLGQLAQPRRELRILRCRDNEEGSGHIRFAYHARIVQPDDIRTGLAQITRLFQRFLVVGRADYDATPSGEIETHRIERRRQHLGRELHRG